MHESRGVQGLPEENLVDGYRVGDLMAIKNKPDFSYRDPPNWTTVCPKPAASSLNTVGFSTSRLDPSQEARTKEYSR